MFKDRPTLASRLPYILSLLSLVVALIAIVLILQSASPSSESNNEGSTTEVAMTDTQQEEQSQDEDLEPVDQSETDAEESEDEDSTDDESESEEDSPEASNEEYEYTYPDLSLGKGGYSDPCVYNHHCGDLYVWGNTYLNGELHVTGESFHEDTEHFQDIDVHNSITNEEGDVVVDDSLTVKYDLTVEGDSFHEGEEYFEFTETKTAYVNDLIVTGTSEHFGPELYHDEIDSRMYIVNNGDCCQDKDCGLEPARFNGGKKECNAPVTIDDDLLVTGDTRIKENLYVFGESFHFDDEHFFAGIDARGTIYNRHGDVMVDDSLRVSGDLSARYDLAIGHDAYVREDLYVGDDGEIRDDLSVGDDLTVGDNATIRGNLVVQDHTDLGTSLHDTLSVSARIDTSLIPQLSGLQDLGSKYSTWSTLFVDTVDTADIYSNSIVLEPKVNSDLAIEVINTSGDTKFEVDGHGNIRTIGNARIGGELKVFGPVTVNAQLTTMDLMVTGTASINMFDSHLLPETTNTYNLGSNTNRWLEIWGNSANFSDNVTVAGSLILGSSAINVEDSLNNLDTRLVNVESTVYVDHAGRITALETTSTDHETRITDLENRSQVIGGTTIATGSPGIFFPVTVTINVGVAHEALTITPMGTGLQSVTIVSGENSPTVTVEVYGSNIGASLTGLQWTAVL